MLYIRAYGSNSSSHAIWKDLALSLASLGGQPSGLEYQLLPSFSSWASTQWTVKIMQIHLFALLQSNGSAALGFAVE